MFNLTQEEKQAIRTVQRLMERRHRSWFGMQSHVPWNDEVDYVCRIVGKAYGVNREKLRTLWEYDYSHHFILCYLACGEVKYGWGELQAQ